MVRKTEKAITGQVYHVFNKSISDYKIFNTPSEYERMLNAIRYYQICDLPLSFSKFVVLDDVKLSGFNNALSTAVLNKNQLVTIIAHALMPTHFHLILKQLVDDGISTFCSNLQNSYACYFNKKHKRKGPLWEGTYEKVLVKTDEQLLHLTRYVHLNPVTAYLVDKPEKWIFSSYREYLGLQSKDNSICEFLDLLEIKPSSYKEFVEDRISHQRHLAKIYKLLID